MTNKNEIQKNERIMGKMRRVTVHLTTERWAVLDEVAKVERRSVTAQCEVLIFEYLDILKKRKARGR